MQSKLEEELAALRQKHAQLKEQWEQAKELLAGKDRVVQVQPERLAEIDRVCDVAARPTHTQNNIQNGAIRA
jgi:hypothetical protein